MNKNSEICDIDGHEIIMKTECLSPTPIHTYDAIEAFLKSRQLDSARNYKKEILATCNISDQTAFGIATVSNALSFVDHYWLRTDPSQTWENMNLFENSFTREVSMTAITGKTYHVTEALVTGELNVLGMHDKCFIRKDRKTYLCKRVSYEEAYFEIIASAMLDILQFDHVKYESLKIPSQQNSTNPNKLPHFTQCLIFTTASRELRSFRDMQRLHDDNKAEQWKLAYNELYNEFPVEFLRMMLFDYLTLNIDRNIDNYGILIGDGKKVFCPYFDHDSCFKSDNLETTYFASGMSFHNTLTLVKNDVHGQEAAVPFRRLDLDLIPSFVLLEQDTQDQVYQRLQRIKSIIK